MPFIALAANAKTIPSPKKSMARGKSFLTPPPPPAHPHPAPPPRSGLPGIVLPHAEVVAAVDPRHDEIGLRRHQRPYADLHACRWCGGDRIGREVAADRDPIDIHRIGDRDRVSLAALIVWRRGSGGLA